MALTGAPFTEFTQELGAIAVGQGRQVLPRPDIPAGHNPITRTYDVREFAWNSNEAGPVAETGAETGVIPVGYEVPDSYIIELTPDLGWTNKEAMFESYLSNIQGNGNALLKRFTNLRIGTDVTCEATPDSPTEHKIVYSVPRVEMIKLINPEYHEYLWRVLSVRDDGIESFPSTIQRFKAIVKIADLDWTIDPFERPRSLTITLAGTKTPDVSAIEVDGFTGGTVIHNPTRWSYETPLTGLDQELLLRAIDLNSNTSAFKTVMLSMDTGRQDYQKVWNNTDELGLLVDLERIPEEDNVNYKRRILDAYKHRAGPRYKGLINGLVRELDMTYDDIGLTILPGQNGDTFQDLEGINLAIGPKYIQVDADIFNTSQEYHTLDPWEWSITLNKDPISALPLIQAPLGTTLDQKNRWEIENNKVFFKNADLVDTPIYVTYEYIEKYDLSTGTVQDAITWLTGLAIEDTNIFTSVATGATIDTGSPATYLWSRDGAKSGDNVYTTFGNETNTGLPIRWNNGSIRSLSDDEFQAVHIQSDKTFFGSKIEKWAHFLRSHIHTQWGFLIADRNVWSDPENPQLGNEFLTTTYDPTISFWQASSPAASTSYTHIQARALNYIHPVDGSDMIPKGIPSALMRSGIGDGVDLKVVIVSEEATQIVQAESEILIRQRTRVRDTVGIEGEPIVNSGTLTLPACGNLVL